MIVGGVEAEVDGVGVGGDLADELGVGGVTADGFDSGDRRVAAAVDHANSLTLVDERVGDSATCWAGTEHDVHRGGHDCTALAGTNQPMMMLCRNVEAMAP